MKVSKLINKFKRSNNMGCTQSKEGGTAEAPPAKAMERSPPEIGSSRKLQEGGGEEKPSACTPLTFGNVTLRYCFVSQRGTYPGGELQLLRVHMRPMSL